MWLIVWVACTHRLCVHVRPSSPQLTHLLCGCRDRRPCSTARRRPCAVRTIGLLLFPFFILLSGLALGLLSLYCGTHRHIQPNAGPFVYTDKADCSHTYWLERLCAHPCCMYACCALQETCGVVICSPSIDGSIPGQTGTFCRACVDNADKDKRSLSFQRAPGTGLRERALA